MGSRPWHRPRLVVAATAALALATCSSTGATAVVHRGTATELRTGELTAADVAAAQTAFGVDLLRGICAAQADDTLLLSPASAAQALALLHPAAAGQTAVDLGALLHLPAWSPELAAALRDQTDALAALRSDADPDDDDAPDALRVSNRLWTASGLHPDRRYLDDIATAFAAELRSLDFAGDPRAATAEINETVEEDTAGLIPGLFDQDLPAATVVVLTNALHLRARWATPFTGTTDAPFAAPSGAVTVGMMRGGSGTAHRTAGWQAVELPYRDGTLVAVAVLPPEGTDPCAVDGTLLTALAAASPEAVDVSLPRMQLEQSHDLLGPLTRLGLPLQGDWSALGRPGLEISQVVQKTYLRVDERGTEAAAATGVAMAVSARAPRPTVVFDRPFLFLLTDTQTRSPLFLAVVTDPTT